MAFKNSATTNTAFSPDAEVKAKTQEKKNLTESVVDLGKKIEEAQSQLKTHTDLTNQCDVLGVQVKDLQKEKLDLEAVITKLKKEKVEAQINVNSEQENLSKFQGLDGQIKEANNSLTLVAQKINTARSTEKKEKAQADEVLYIITQKVDLLEKNKFFVESKISSLKSEIKDIENEKISLKEDVGDFVKQNREVQKKIDNANKTLDTIKGQVHNVELTKDLIEKTTNKLRIDFDKQVDKQNKEYQIKLVDLEEREGAMSDREQWVKDNLKYLKKMVSNYERTTGNKLRISIED